MKIDKHFILIIKLAVFVSSIIFPQKIPYNPPITKLVNLNDGVLNLNLQIQHFVNTDLSLINSNPIQKNKLNCYQTPINMNSSREIEIIIENAFNSNNEFYYIRYINNGFLGPYNLSNQIKNENNILKINGIKPTEFTIEYCTEMNQFDKNPTLTLVRQMGDLNNGILVQSNSNYWKRNFENPTVLVTGFWPPTNEMIRHFSQNSDLNPNGWVGDDWENRGFDIVSYFPEFAEPDCNDCGMGFGDLEVDYQDTSDDFWIIVDEVKPIAIITFSRGFIDHSWELEFNFYNRTNWYSDYLDPTLPTPNPPDESVENYFERNSSLPLEEIENAVEEAELGLNAYIDWQGDPGHFVSEFMGYHGAWYRDINQESENNCHIAGHIHVGGLIDWETATEATHITLRKVIDHLDQFDYILGDLNEDMLINIQDLLIMVQFILGIQDPTIGQSFASDINIDGTINIQDIIILINIILGN